MRVSDHALIRYLERELQLDTAHLDGGDNVILNQLEREHRDEFHSARKTMERIFQRPRMTKILKWAKDAEFRVIIDRRVYCCSQNTVTTFFIKDHDT